MHLYRDFVVTLSERFQRALDAMDIEHNFEAGAEFEVALCTTLRTALPQRFGICRGYAVTPTGDTAGDDILIFDQQLFPTLRAVEAGDYSQKERVPIEAIYAYVEAKHSLELSPDGTFSKALDQVSKVKALCSGRADVPHSKITRNTSLGAGFNVPGRDGWPPIKNPLYTAIIGRHVRSAPGTNTMPDPSEITQGIQRGEFSVPLQVGPDLVVAGSSNIVLPILEVGGRTSVMSPFALPSANAAHAVYSVDRTAFGIGLVHLLWALDSIELGPLPWSRILMDGLSRPL